MPSLTITVMLPCPLRPWCSSPRPQCPAPPRQRRGTHKHPHAWATLQAQAQSQDRAKTTALWEVMMRPV